MRTLLPVLVAFAVTACGGLENEPLTLGVIRGNLIGSTPKSSVSIFQKPEFISTVDGNGDFELRGVPRGTADLLVIINDDAAERVQVEVEGGVVTNLGSRKGRPTGTLEIELIAPAWQKVDKGTVVVEGTPLELEVSDPNEREFKMPAGCYRVTATVPGLGTKHDEPCVREGVMQEVHMVFPIPDGSPGREGCKVTGCQFGLTCRADGACWH